MMDKKEKGRFGEDAAARFLEGKGFHILARNFSMRGGEIDLVGFRKGTLVFFEVKARSGDSWGKPAEAITEEKMEKIAKAADGFLKMHCEDGTVEIPFFLGFCMKKKIRVSRIDGVEVYLTREGGLSEVRHIENLMKIEM